MASRRYAHVFAVAVEIWCPECPRDYPNRPPEHPIPDLDGNRTWGRLPETVTCPDCKRTFRVRQTVVSKWIATQEPTR